MNILLTGRDTFEVEANLSICQQCFGLDPIYHMATNFKEAQNSILSDQALLIIVDASNLQQKSDQSNNLLIAIQLKGYSSNTRYPNFNLDSSAEIISLKREFSIEEILRALLKVYTSNQLQNAIKAPKQRIAIPIKGGFKFVELNQILRLEAAGSYTVIYLNSGKKITASKRIGLYMEILPKDKFLRVHQSHIINVKLVDELRKAGEFYVLLKGKEKIPIAKQRLEYVQKMLFNGCNHI